MNAQLNYNIRVIIKFINYSTGILLNMPKPMKSMRPPEVGRIDLTHFLYYSHPGFCLTNGIRIISFKSIGNK